LCSDVFTHLRKYSVLDEDISSSIAFYIDSYFSDKEKDFYLNKFSIVLFYKDYLRSFDRLVELFREFLSQAVLNFGNLVGFSAGRIGFSSFNDIFSFLKEPDFIRLVLKRNFFRDFSVAFSFLSSTFDYVSINYDNFEVFKGFYFDRLFDKSVLVFPDYFRYRFLNGDLYCFSPEYSGKFDLYIDTSSSMSSFVNVSGISVSKLVYSVSAGIYLLSNMDLGDVYFFSSSAKKVQGDILRALLTVSPAGGTDINKVLDNIKHTGRYSLVITDGEISVNRYIDYSKVYFVFVGKKPFSFFYPYIVI
jgi:hypothetical protein